MTTSSAYSAGDPHQLLSSTRELTQRVRRTQRATWFPLLVFAAVTFAAIPMFRYGWHLGARCPPVHLGKGTAARSCYVVSPGSVYWPVTFVLAYAAIAVFYIRRSRARGVGTRVRPYVITGIIVAALGTGVSVWAFHRPSIIGGGPHGSILIRLISYAAAIGLALLVLAWAERNPALLVLAVVYLVIVVVPINFGWFNPPYPWRWGFLPGLVIQGSVLLLGGIGFALAQRPWQRAA